MLPLDPHPHWTERPVHEMQARASAFADALRERRTVREFSERTVPEGIIRDAVRAAGYAPNGANMQPWHFVAVQDPTLKARIRAAAEEEERRFYGDRASVEWLEDLEPLGTDANKPFLETAPWLIAVFAERFRVMPDGSQRHNYYVTESVGIATGFLIAALHAAGLVMLTHTPSPMAFLGDLLERPSNERAFLLLVVGYPSEDARVPRITKKPVDQILTIR